jgi:hypothetical protein
MKTAIQTACNEIIVELIDKVEIGYMTKIISIMHKNLKTEKQQIIDAATHGANFDKSPYSSAHEYYERTYTTNKETLK